ncbi:MAG TPA: peptide deformylase, partial [Spirochaetaceae bacterium]|nr:peptide deformylase [Spirochaetaceae bacterium]
DVEGDRKRVFVNPEIIMTSTEQVEYEEGCLSFPGLYFMVKRPAAVKIQALDERGKVFTLEADGLLARVILHENDHLDGKLFIDRISPFKRERALKHYERLIKM